ncbi:RNA polymerase sigma factor, sigma-70 family [Bernardetia litoralis DSM 6794]|uniref:RNA polymerase sigma factor n=1 Tax=Bernardetia litoralis (strain ATCC 23117 / DSM 6794 / NBRC 15988 / NCIMB 1366 / Fx l1 / Sio-4) TaxID=880071 RepID=I4APJ6_BERLS|nr:RNA polymerase sigma factor, sigma-70 family [Bernardetia litoralis DSM 6794]
MSETIQNSQTEEEQKWILQLQNPQTTSKERTIAFDGIMRLHRRAIYSHIRKMVIDADDTDDLLQEVFVKVWKNIAKFKNESKLYTWIYRIATNETLRFLDRKKKKQGLKMNETSEQLMQNLESDEQFSGEEVQLILQKAILTLPDKQRLVFNMKYFDEMKYDEISEIVDTSVGALKASYHLATKKIEAYLKENYQ